MNALKKLVVFSASAVSKVPWLFNSIKFFVHLVPPLEKRIVGVLYPYSVPVSELEGGPSGETVLLNEHGMFVYEKIKFRLESI